MPDERPDGALRLFVAVPVGAGALEATRTLLDRVRQGPAGRGARWVRTENLHLTLRFLGATSPARVDGVMGAVRTAAASVSPFGVSIAGAGAFPSLARPRALWLGIEDGAAELASMAAALEAPLRALGWPAEERPFRPHLTVARTDAASIADGSLAASALASAAAGWRVSFPAERVVLYRSQLRAGPPVYEALGEAWLGLADGG